MADRARGGGRTMDDIGNRDRVALMQRLVELKLEHRDLDVVIHHLGNDPAHDQLQLTRLKRRKLLLKDQIARIEREIDPDVSA
jgi:hypothetical protein